MEKRKSPKGFLVVLPGEIIEIPQDSDKSWQLAEALRISQGGLTFEIEKGRLSFRLAAPYSEERRRGTSEWAKKNGISKNERQT